MSDATPTLPPGSPWGAFLNRLSILFAYCGGGVVAALGIMSVVSIVGRAALSRPITGDFELVEIGTAIAGTLFLPYCQASDGHIVVDIFTLRSSQRTRDWLDRFGYFLMALMFFAVGWRSVIGSMDMRQTGEVSMLLGIPTWIGYVAIVPGVFVAGVIALAQSFGVTVSNRVAHE
jgi:TRAP-type C4-dicarboxylate transport system permease small subunit